MTATPQPRHPRPHPHPARDQDWRERIERFLQIQRQARQDREMHPVGIVERHVLRPARRVR